jgi:hypothetical protein
MEHYTAFLLAEPQSAGCVPLAEVAGGEFAHDAAKRFLNREAFSARDLFEAVRPLMKVAQGHFVHVHRQHCTKQEVN